MMRTSKPNFNEILSRPFTITTLVLTISLLLLFLPLNVSNGIKMACVMPVRPFQWATCLSSNTASDFFHRIAYIWTENETNTERENEVAVLKNKIIELQDTNYKLQDKLSAVSDFHKEQKKTKSHIIPADIIGYDTSIFRRSITINVGIKHGVKDNNVVVAKNALVGVISVAGARTSQVRLITDPASRIPGRILRTRDQVIIEGNASPYCQLKYVPRWTTLKKSDKVVTSDVGSFYIASLPIATVIENETKGGALFQSVKALPLVNISKIENVLVIKE